MNVAAHLTPLNGGAHPQRPVADVARTLSSTRADGVDSLARIADTDGVVHGDRLANAVYRWLSDFVSYPTQSCVVAHTLWILHTYFLEELDSTPRIAFLSPEPGSGKTRALEVTAPLVPRPVAAVNVSSAYLFRKVSDKAGRPTVLYDEIDTVFGPRAKEHEDVRGLLNAGHRKAAVAGRCKLVGKTVELEELPAYCAVALAGLGKLPDSILTRSIIIPMRRRAPDDVVKPYRERVYGPHGKALQGLIEQWAFSVRRLLGHRWPDLPPEITDRAADCWEGLIAIAELLGDDWLALARKAASELVELNKAAPASLGLKLLDDLRALFGNHSQLRTTDILDGLHQMEEAPWGDIKGRPLDARRLGNLLKPYGVSSTTLRVGGATPKGYRVEDLHDAWTRYLPSSPKAAATSETSATQVLAGSSCGVRAPAVRVGDES